MSKGLYKMKFSCGRRGPDLTGIFIAEKKYIDYLIKHQIEIHFGEVAGKHSNVCGPIDEDEIQLVTDDPKVIDIFIEHKLSTGHNPLHHRVAYFKHDNMPDEEFEDLDVEEAIDKLLEKEKV